MTQQASTVPDLRIAIVLGISRLGEADMRGWWRTNALSRAGRYVLGNSFPKTQLAAGLEVNVLSATHRHGDLLVRPTALHLFSDLLPFRRLAMAWIAETKITHDDAFIQGLGELDIDGLLDQLRRWSDADETEGELVGAGLFLGNVTQDDIEDVETQLSVAKTLAAAYLVQGAGFRPPYFDLKT